MTTSRLTRIAWLALVLSMASVSPSESQLLSPGRLARPHSELEGLRNCTSCHTLGQRGVSAQRCLECHTELGERISRRSGFHATVKDQNCADCHQDHLGTDFDIRRLDEGQFDHDDAGYALGLSHASAECRDCHEPSHITDSGVVALKTERGVLSRTFLGLSADCRSCHGDESPHRNQFGDRGCAECHDEGVWTEPTSFEHSATRYPLAGLHAPVSCAACHGEGAEATYRPLEFARCDDCHADPHGGVMGSECSSCHRVAGWNALSSGNVERTFDHSATRFPLGGAHAAATCRACHQPGRPPRNALLRMTYAAGTQASTYPRPLFQSCRACHVDQHAAPRRESRWADCTACHSETRWAPSPYNMAMHADSPFPLTGAHAVTPCVSCHEKPEAGPTFTLALTGQRCVDCHESDDPHEGVYEGMTCEGCHVTDAWDLARLDHAALLERAEPESCATCHSVDDQHAGQFEARDCAECHGTESFTIESFDHDRTAFPLDGAHDDAPCASCHATEPGSPGVVRYRPLGTDCADCHVGG